MTALASIMAVTQATNAMDTPDIHTFESAWRKANLVVTGTVADFNRDRGAAMQVQFTLRGSAPDTTLLLCDTAQAVYLDHPGTPLAIFVGSLRPEGCAELVYPAGAGGVLWQDLTALDAIQLADTDPAAALESDNPRARLAAAYYLATDENSGGNNARALRGSLLNAALWGLEQAVSETNQAALTVMQVLDIPVGNYHPTYRLELKKKTAQELRARWAVD